MPKDNKRKRSDNHYNTHPPPKQNGNSTHSNGPDTSKPTAIFHPTTPRTSTLSIALPGSIIANAKSHDAKTYLAGTIARALAVFNVDEVVIFNDAPLPSTSRSTATDTEGYTTLSDPCHFLAHLLSYLETPPHLRKALFPMHPNLRTAGTLPSLDMPHHLRANEHCPFREGVTLPHTTNSTAKGTQVETGLPTPSLLPSISIPPNTRLTLRLPTSSNPTATAVSQSTPRTEGYYWGYTVRSAPSLSSIFTESPFENGYDLSIGTSERGLPISSLYTTPSQPHQHVLLVFGGVAGLEAAATCDPVLSQKGITGSNVGELFDHWINLVPGQGSRTIRTEEAVWCGLMGLRGFVEERRKG